MDLHVHPAFTAELADLDRSAPAEARAIRNALGLLAAEGATLGYPWSSAVRGSAGLRELRPRRGRSAWRVLYRRSQRGVEVLALAPEARSDRRRFERARHHAIARAATGNGAK